MKAKVVSKKKKMAEGLELIVGRLDGKFNAFIESHNLDNERIYAILKENKEYLLGEVSKTLNSHAQIKKDIAELKEKEFNCPIHLLKIDVEKIKKETEEDRFLGKYPELKKANNVWNLAKTIGIIIFVIATLVSIYLDLRVIVSK